MEKKKILLVDDDLDLILSVKSFLKGQGYDVISALNRYEGLELAKSELPNLAILDVMMTYQKEGFDLAKDLRREPSLQDIPIIVFSGIDKATGIDYKSKAGSAEIPVDAYVEKPVEMVVLLEEVKRLLK
jgi:two-component system, OmpR family, alkaline phosphatase synthesis response regulator PhoP